MGESNLELELAMLRRVRRHLLISVLGIIGGIACLFLVHWAGVLLFHAEPPRAYLLAYLPCFLLIPVIGLISAHVNVRCPSCNGSVVWQTSANASRFASMAQKNCLHCGKPIFGSVTQRSWRRTFITVFVLTVLLFAFRQLLLH